MLKYEIFGYSNTSLQMNAKIFFFFLVQWLINGTYPEKPPKWHARFHSRAENPTTTTGKRLTSLLVKQATMCSAVFFFLINEQGTFMIFLPHVNFVSSLVILRVPGSKSKTVAFKSCEKARVCKTSTAVALGETQVCGVLLTWDLGDPLHSRMPCGGLLRGDVTHTVDRKGRGPESPASSTAVVLGARNGLLCTVTSQENGVACRPCLPDFLGPGTRLPVARHLQTLFGKRCLRAKHLRPKPVCLIVRPGLPGIPFENMIHLIGFRKAGFMLSVPEPHPRSPFWVYLHSQIDL